MCFFGGAWFFYRPEDAGDPPRLLVLVGGIASLVVLALMLRKEWEARRALLGASVIDLPRRQVTVVGYTERGEVVVADGLVPASQIITAATADPHDAPVPFPTLFRLASVQRGATAFVAGDVLIAHGTFGPDQALVVDDGTSSRWVYARSL